MVKKPQRDDIGLDCPLYRKPVHEVCHKCDWYVQLRGTHPQTGEPIQDEWGCAINVLVASTLGTMQQTMQAGAAVESFRNVSVLQNNAMLKIATGQTPEQLPIIDVTPIQTSKMIEGK